MKTLTAIAVLSGVLAAMGLILSPMAVRGQSTLPPEAAQSAPDFAEDRVTLQGKVEAWIDGKDRIVIAASLIVGQDKNKTQYDIVMDEMGQKLAIEEHGRYVEVVGKVKLTGDKWELQVLSFKAIEESVGDFEENPSLGRRPKLA